MKKKLLFIAALIALQYNLFSQAILWSEDFEPYAAATGLRGTEYTQLGDYPAGTTFVIDASNLTLSNDNDYIRVNGGDLEVRDIDGEGIITFNTVDISSQTGDVTINIGQVNFDITSSKSTWTGGEYIDVEYSLDEGETFILFPNHNGEGTVDHTFVCPTGLAAGEDHNTSFSDIISPGAATSLILRLKVFNDGANERFEIDDIEILRNSVSLFAENFQSYEEGTGIDGSDTDRYDVLGDYASVTKWTLTLTEDTQLLDHMDYARTTANSFNGTLVFKLQDVNSPVTFETESIDITGESQITFGLDLYFDTIGATSSGYETSDFFDIYYALDGGAFVLAQDNGAGHTYSGTAGGIGSTPSESGGILSANGTTPQSEIESTNFNFSQTLNGLSASTLAIKFVMSNDDGGSEDYEFDNIQVVVGSTLGKKDIILDNAFKIYPNPVADGILNIDNPFQKEKNIVIFDMLGKRVFETKTSNSRIDLSQLNPGLYTLMINKTNAKKIIIK